MMARVRIDCAGPFKKNASEPARWLVGAFLSAMLLATPTALADCDPASEREPLVDYVLSPGVHIANAIVEPLTDVEGDAAAGLDAFVDRDKGNCLACHKVTSLMPRIDAEPAVRERFGFQGTVGPSLDGVSERYTAGELRLIIADPEQALGAPAAAGKPSYYRVDGIEDVSTDCEGQPILSPVTIENIVSYLRTLRQ